MIRSTLKKWFPAFVGILVFASCSSSKKATTVERNDVKGTWTLDRISYEGLASSERLRLILLDEGPESCLTGTTWVLPNNGYGSYTINSSAAGCVPGKKNIVWSYREENGQPVLQYKKLPGGEKAKDVTEGYRFKILSASGTSMVLQSQISYQGNPVYINYNFSKPL
jgi:hypothetical protein